jgi:hypothetical protein
MSFSQSIFQLINIKISETQIVCLIQLTSRILNSFSDIINDLKFTNAIENVKEIDFGRLIFETNFRVIPIFFLLLSSFKSSDIPKIYLTHPNGKEYRFLNINSNLRSSRDQLFKIDCDKISDKEFH